MTNADNMEQPRETFRGNPDTWATVAFGQGLVDIGWFQVYRAAYVDMVDDAGEHFGQIAERSSAERVDDNARSARTLYSFAGCRSSQHGGKGSA